MSERDEIDVEQLVSELSDREVRVMLCESIRDAGRLVAAVKAAGHEMQPGESGVDAVIALISGKARGAASDDSGRSTPSKRNPSRRPRANRLICDRCGGLSFTMEPGGPIVCGRCRGSGYEP